MPGTDGEEIWLAYAKGVKPLKPVKTGKAAASKLAGRMKSPSSKSISAPKIVPDKLAKQRSSTSFHTPLDHRAERRLRQGTVTIEARLDLHGMHQDEAHMALDQFVALQLKAGHRCLLVITGKGRGGAGILRSNLAGWLAANAAATHILALRPAAARHGGEGAFYVMLRRGRD